MKHRNVKYYFITVKDNHIDIKFFKLAQEVRDYYSSLLMRSFSSVVKVYAYLCVECKQEVDFYTPKESDKMVKYILNLDVSDAEKIKALKELF